MEIKGIAKDVAWVEQHGYTRLTIGNNKVYINAKLSNTINGTKVQAQGELKANKKGEPYFLTASIVPHIKKRKTKGDIEKKEKKALMPILQYLKAQGKKGRAEKVLRCKETPEDILRAPHLLYLSGIINFTTAEALLDCVFAANNEPERLASIVKHELDNAYNSSKSCLSLAQIKEIAEHTYALPATEDEIKKVKKSVAIIENQNVYIPKIYSFRSKVLKHIYNNLPTYSDYEDEQIAELMSHKYTILTGGAGTGKTTILNKIADMKGLNVAMTALTGKAATRLTGGRTLHSLLGFNRGKFTVTHLLNDLVVVDEASMLDWYTASALFKAAKGNIVFSGDPKQLPPVKGGSVFKEIIELLPCVELTQTHRFQTSDGKLKIEHIRKNNVFDLVNAVIMLALKLKAQNADYAVITPIKNCQFGTYNLNERLRESLNPEGLPLDSYFRVGDKIVVTRNVYYDRELYAANGETGVVTGIKYIDYQKFIAVKIGTDKKLIEEADLELAFCLTVHKVQGSQADYVIFVNPKSYVNVDFMSVEMLETGQTRSRRTTYCLTL